MNMTLKEFAKDLVSVPLFGDSFFICDGDAQTVAKAIRFPSPYSGILFLSSVILEESAEEKERFRPLIRGFFFYTCKLFTKHIKFGLFPSPYSGILFLFQADYAALCSRIDEFPSPYSGILFL